MTATQTAANVVDLATYRAHRRRPSVANEIGQSDWMLTVPVLIPMPVVAWVPFWSPMFAALANGSSDE